MSLSIVIVSWNARADLERCLSSLSVSPPHADHEIVVVDNASNDGAPEMVAERFPGVRLIRAGGNLGSKRMRSIDCRRGSTSGLTWPLPGRASWMDRAAPSYRSVRCRRR